MTTSPIVTFHQIDWINPFCLFKNLINQEIVRASISVNIKNILFQKGERAVVKPELKNRRRYIFTLIQDRIISFHSRTQFDFSDPVFDEIAKPPIRNVMKMNAELRNNRAGCFRHTVLVDVELKFEFHCTLDRT